MQISCNSNPQCTHGAGADKRVILDHAGAVVSTLCAIHCLLCAVAPGVLALAGTSIVYSHETEWALVALSVGIGTAAAIGGYRVHRSGRIVLQFAVSGAVILASRPLEAYGIDVLATVLAVLGGLLIVSAHVSNHSATGTAMHR